MRVTPEMKTEGGGRLDKLADFLGTDERTGIKTVIERGEIDITVDSTVIPNHMITFDPATAEDFALDVLAKVREIREARGVR